MPPLPERLQFIIFMGLTCFISKKECVGSSQRVISEFRKPRCPHRLLEEQVTHCALRSNLALMLLILLPCSLLQSERAATPPKMQDHPETTDRAAQKTEGYRPEQTLY